MTHYEIDYKKIDKILISLCLILFMIGYYKNGLIYVLHGELKFINTLNYILMLGISMLITYLFKRKNITSKDIIKAFLMVLLIPPRLNIYIYTFIVILFNVIKKYIKDESFLDILIYKVVLCLLMPIINLDYQNIIEVSTNYLYGSLDNFIGEAVGNFGTTSILLIIVFFFVSTMNYYFKKDVSIYAFTTFIILEVISSLVFHNNFVINILNSNMFFTTLILLPRVYTPVYKHFEIIFGIIFSIISFLMLKTGIVNAPYYCLLIMEIFFYILRRLYIIMINKKYNN